MTKCMWRMSKARMRMLKLAAQFAGEFMVLAALFGLILMFMCISSQGRGIW